MTKDIGPLWHRVRQGDHDAWGELVRRYAGLVHSIALKAGLGSADAEDCSQHTWLALYRRRASIRDPEAIPAWLMRTTRRQALRMARRLGREVELEKADSLADPGPTAEERFDFVRFQSAVNTALGQLDPRCRELLLQFFANPNQPSYKKIAQGLGLRANSLGPLRSRCLARLGEILKKMGWDLN